MKLAIFDIDGTLTNTDDVDSRCFVQAFSDEFQIKNINTNWAEYGHTTDSGITLQIFQEYFGRAPEASELSRLQRRFLNLLQEKYTATPALFVEIPGASVMLQRLVQAQDWAIAFATGGWRASACVKLQAAGLDVEGLPMAFADDSISREDIVRTAIARAKALYAQPDFEKIVCIGDGIWDVMTAAQLELAFVGVGSARQTMLRAGVEHIVEFVDFDRFFQALNTASIPKRELLQVQQKFQGKSLSPSYFEALYHTNVDPWGFETSEYEANKYAATLAALPKERYRSAFEIGGSIGVLTAKLANRCDSLLSVDVSELAQNRAIARCQALPQVRFQLMRVPEQYPEEMFDLTLVSEVGYYWSWEDLKKSQRYMLDHLESGGNLLLVHWTLYAQDYPLSGDEVHDSFLALPSSELKHLQGYRAEQYRLDLFERV